MQKNIKTALFPVQNLQSVETTTSGINYLPVNRLVHNFRRRSPKGPEMTPKSAQSLFKVRFERNFDRF